MRGWEECRVLAALWGKHLHLASGYFRYERPGLKDERNRGAVFERIRERREAHSARRNRSRRFLYAQVVARYILYLMSQSSFTRLAIMIFAVLGVIHLYRGFAGLPLTLGNWQAPLYVSFIESAVFLLLAYLGYRANTSTR